MWIVFYILSPIWSQKIQNKFGIFPGRLASNKNVDEQFGVIQNSQCHWKLLHMTWMNLGFLKSQWIYRKQSCGNLFRIPRQPFFGVLKHSWQSCRTDLAIGNKFKRFSLISKLPPSTLLLDSNNMLDLTIIITNINSYCVSFLSTIIYRYHPILQENFAKH